MNKKWLGRKFRNNLKIKAFLSSATAKDAGRMTDEIEKLIQKGNINLRLIGKVLLFNRKCSYLASFI